MWNRIGNWWARWDALARLRHLDDRLLADIGLQRESLHAQLMQNSVVKGQVPDDEVCACCQLRLQPAEPALHGSGMRHKRRGL